METKNEQSVGQTRENGQSQGVAAVAAGSAITREQWLERCSARFTSVAGLPKPEADEIAAMQLKWLCDDLGEDPEMAADAEMQEWVD